MLSTTMQKNIPLNRKDDQSSHHTVENVSAEILTRHKFSSDILKELQKTYTLNNWRGIGACVQDHAIIFLSAYLAESYPWLLPFAIIVIGCRQRALATLLHEAAHLCLAKNRLLNRILGSFLSGYLIFQSWFSYKKSHVLSHHHFLGNSHFDPDYAYYIESGVYQKRSRSEFLVQYLWKPLLLLKTFSTLKYLVTNRLTKDIKGIEFFYIAVSVSIYCFIGAQIAGWKFFLLYWLLPYVTVFQIVSWFIELSEHYPLVGKVSTDIHASRNRFGNWLERFLTGAHGESYHLVHHLFPRLPYWNMKRAHQILLQDDTYRKINSTFGGIFTSANKNAPLWRSHHFFGITQ